MLDIAARSAEWAAWVTAVDHLPGITPAERRAYQEIFIAEGGCRIEGGRPAARELVPVTLDEVIARCRLARAGATPLAFPPLDARAAAYRAYFDRVLRAIGGRAALAGLAQPEAAAAFADTVFLHGGIRGGRLIAAVAAETAGLPADARPGLADALSLFDALGREKPTRLRLLERLAALRLADVRRLATAGLVIAPGREQERIRRFRFAEAGSVPAGPASAALGLRLPLEDAGP